MCLSELWTFIKNVILFNLDIKQIEQTNNNCWFMCFYKCILIYILFVGLHNSNRWPK